MEKEVLEWQKDRDVALRTPESWLTLVGLHWLDVGSNTIGNASTNKFQFPNCPPQLGVVNLSEDHKVSFTPSDGVSVTANGNPVSGTIELTSDANDATPTELGYQSLTWFIISRDTPARLAIRVKDRESPVLKSFPGLKYYPVDPKFCFEADFVPLPEPVQIKVNFDTETAYGNVVFTLEGKSYQLTAFGKPSEPLWLIFKDQTSGKTTYGGGRFLYTGIPNSQNKVVVNFNKAYAPPCSFTSFATCPWPPPGNALPIEILAGELALEGH